MPLTITVTLDDEDVEHFLSLYNDDAGTDITVDMINQNPDLAEAIAADMVTFWFDTLEDDDHGSAFDLYSDSLADESVFTLPGDPAMGSDDLDDEG